MLRTSFVALALGLLSSTASAADRWDGADDLPVNPLSCDGAAPAVASKPYDGGQPTGAPDLAGKPITIVDVPKLIGIGYFNATSKGIQEGAKELGNVTATTDGPTKANIDEKKTSDNPEIKRFLGIEGDFGAAIGLSNDWAYNVIKQVGNYGEIFDANIGPSTQLGIARGLNNLWSKGGIQYAPPIR